MFSSMAFLDNPEVWKSVAFFFSVGIVTYPVYKLLIRVVKNRSKEIMINWEDALKLRKEAESLLWNIQHKNFYKDAERKKIIRKALKDARVLKENSSKELSVRLSSQKKEMLERIHLIRFNGLINLKERVVDVAVKTTFDVLNKNEKMTNKELFVDMSLGDLEWLLNQKEVKEQLIKSV